jgi:hypothetical protein
VRSDCLARLAQCIINLYLRGRSAAGRKRPALSPGVLSWSTRQIDRRLPNGEKHRPCEISHLTADLLAIMTAGAYGAVQSDSYRTLVPEVLVQGRPIRNGAPRVEVGWVDCDGSPDAVAVS